MCEHAFVQDKQNHVYSLDPPFCFIRCQYNIWRWLSYWGTVVLFLHHILCLKVPAAVRGFTCLTIRRNPPKIIGVTSTCQIHNTSTTATAANPDVKLNPLYSRYKSYCPLVFPTSQSFQISGSVSPLLWISCTKALRVSRELGLMNGRLFPCSNASFVLRHRLL